MCVVQMWGGGAVKVEAWSRPTITPTFAMIKVVFNDAVLFSRGLKLSRGLQKSSNGFVCTAA